MNPLFRTNTYLGRTETAISKIELTSEGLTAIACRDLLLFPGGGGQCADEGILVVRGQSHPVKDLIKRNGDVLMVLQSKIPLHDDLKKGEAIVQEVDMRRRITASILHSTQHAFGAAARLVVPGYETRGMSIEIHDEIGTCEMRFATTDVVTQDMIHATTGFVRTAISNALPIRIEINESVGAVRARYGEAFRIDPSVGDYKGNRLRTVIIGSQDYPLMDVSLCGGTHLHSLSEAVEPEVTGWHYNSANGECHLAFRLPNHYQNSLWNIKE